MSDDATESPKPAGAASSARQAAPSDAAPSSGAAASLGAATSAQKRGRAESPRSFWVPALGGAVVLLAAGLVAVSLHTYFGLPSNATAGQLGSIEDRFELDASSGESGDRLDEWRAARSDHKVIAYAVAHCLGTTIATMSRSTYSVLMLDLQPDGAHWWRTASAGTQTGSASGKDAPAPAAAKPVVIPVTASGTDSTDMTRLTGYEAAALAFSDAVARARLASVAGAAQFFPYMFWFGWLSVIVSAVATALVTLKASMNSGSWPRISAWVGVFAVVFSTGATVLTGAKQFWDPTNAYMRNEGALLGLRQLHEQIALSFISNWDMKTCAPATPAAPLLARWRDTLVSLENGTLAAPVIIQTANNNLQTGADTQPVVTGANGGGSTPQVEAASNGSK